MTAVRSRLGGIGLFVALAVVLSGCAINGSESLPTPFAKGTGSGSYSVKVELSNSANLVPHSEVKIADVTVGSITKLAFKDWHAEATVSLQKGTTLPANAVAKVAQKSLLGAEYLDLSSPAKPTGALRAGDTIALQPDDRFPETEEVLAALSTVLNGSGLSQIETINTELNNALGGRQTDTRSLLANLNTFVGGLNNQRQDIVAAIDNVNRLGASLSQGNKTLATAIDTIGPGLNALNANVGTLSQTLGALDNLNVSAHTLVSTSQTNLVSVLKDLQAPLQALNQSSNQIVGALGELATYPFPLQNATRSFRGDYSNLYAVLDLRCSTLTTNFLTGVPVASALGSLCSATPSLANPLTAPLGGTTTTPTLPTLPSIPSLPKLPALPSILPSLPSLLGGTGSSGSSGGGLLGGLLGGGK
jgi:phospholipid/cholesterol/gamma-HCH transport system substrate-binding protein